MVRWSHLFSYEVIILKRILCLTMTVIILCSIFILPSKAYSSILGAGRVSTQSSALNVRSSPSPTATVKTTLPRNSYVTLISKSGSFWYVQYNSFGYGYCHQNYIYQVTSRIMQVKTSGGRLRVRSSASASAPVSDYITSGILVSVHTTSGDFAKIIYDGGKTGYVSSAYLVKPDSFTAKYSAIKLNVPDFKQTDSRWANVTLGSSGQTIAKIGCATTALAMTESYRTGTIIYPNAMAKKLSYTSGGAVYWPSSYNVVTSASGYLTVIYNALKNGKPVIVGAKNSYGGQHYVVVKGIKQCDTLTASAFYINDPGSTSRTTLNQFFSAYPTFYKMLYVK